MTFSLLSACLFIFATKWTLGAVAGLFYSECLDQCGCSLRCWSGLHRQDSPVSYCERTSHQRRSHHRSAVGSCGEEPRCVVEHGSAAVQGLHRHWWGHQVGEHLFCFSIAFEANCLSQYPRSSLIFFSSSSSISTCAVIMLLQLFFWSPWVKFKNESQEQTHPIYSQTVFSSQVFGPESRSSHKPLWLV